MQSRKGMSTAIKIIVVVVVLIILALIVIIVFRGTAEGVNKQYSESQNFFTSKLDYIKNLFGWRSNEDNNNPSEKHLICNPETLKCEEVDGKGHDQCSAVGESCTPPEIKAYFTFSPENPEAEQSITFDSSESIGNIVLYKWDFGDGTTQNWNDNIITHSYSSPGSYEVKLIVEDEEGNSDEFSATVNVESSASTNTPPVAKFIITPYNAVLEGEEITLDASQSYDNDGYIVAYEWDMGNGDKLNGESVTYSYSVAGQYTITLIVTDDKGSKGQVEWNIVVENDLSNDPPTAVLLFTPESPTTQTKIKFDARESEDSHGRILHEMGLSGTDLTKAEWDFGDGTTAQGWEVYHKYSNPGTYEVKLTVYQRSNSEELTDTETKEISVAEGTLDFPYPHNTKIYGHKSGAFDKETALEFDVQNINSEGDFHNVWLGVKLLNYEYSDPDCASDFTYSFEKYDIITAGETVHFKYTDFCHANNKEMKFNVTFWSNELYYEYIIDCPDSDPHEHTGEDCTVLYPISS